MTDRNTHIPRHDANFVGYRNVTLTGGHFDGMLVEYFRDHRTGVHTQTGIINGVHRVDTYSICRDDVSKAVACDKHGVPRED
ncbi:hypothetical protein [Vibrio phage V-YDF132]|nr:hypothetical protein [Vibrio phage V-YDF132]